MKKIATPYLIIDSFSIEFKRKQSNLKNASYLSVFSRLKSNFFCYDKNGNKWTYEFEAIDSKESFW